MTVTEILRKNIIDLYKKLDAGKSNDAMHRGYRIAIKVLEDVLRQIEDDAE